MLAPKFGETLQLSNIPFPKPRQAVEGVDFLDYAGIPTERFFDNNNGWYNGGQTAVWGTRTNRRYGRDRYQFWTEWDLLRQRDAARFIADSDPLAVGMLGQLVNFTVGSEAQVVAVNKKGIKDDAARELVQSRIDAFKERMAAETGYRQTFEAFCQEYMVMAVTDGERWDRIYPQREGAVVRCVLPEQVTQPPGGTDEQGWHLGVRTPPGDIYKRLGYWITYEPGQQSEGEYVDARDVVMCQRNTPSMVVRGVTDFLPVTDDIVDLGRLIDGIRVGAKVRSKIAYIRTLKGATQDAIEGFVSRTADNLPTASNQPQCMPQSGQRRFRETLPPGSVINAGDNMEISTPGQGAIEEYIAAANISIRFLATRWNLAEFMAASDASNGNYASLLAAGGPVVRAFKMQQSRISSPIRELVKRVLEYDVVLGLLPVGILDTVEIMVQFPSPVVNDPLSNAQVMQMEYLNKIRSRQSWQTAVGLDPDEEDAAILEDTENFQNEIADLLPEPDADDSTGNNKKNGSQND